MHRLIVHICFAVLAVFISSGAGAQDANNLWKGNKAYGNREYDKAMESYQKSLEMSPTEDANYNMANSLYKQKKYEEAAKIYDAIASKSEEKIARAEAYHNLGNAYLKSQKLDKGIEAYKNSLRLNPSDEETRYNLSYALKMKQEQEEQEQEQDQEQDQDQDQNEDKKDQDKQDQEQNQDQEKEDKEEQNQDQQEQDQNQDEQEQEQEQQPRPDEISKEDAERLLENLENDEQKTQEKVKLQQRKSSNVKIENDW